MGKHANQSAYREWERQQNRQQDAYFEAEPEPTDDDREQTASDAYWERLDAVRRYSLPMRHVRVWDEVEVGR